VQLGGLQKRISEIEKLNAEVIAISTAGNQHDVGLTKSFLGITYILIPKPNRKVVKDYGLTYDYKAAAYAIFIIDRKGRIRYKTVDRLEVSNNLILQLIA
jgi:alkyl hydroperoxide reductase subunit AhpC